MNSYIYLKCRIKVNNTKDIIEALGSWILNDTLLTVVGSSRKINDGFAINATAVLTFRLLPPLKSYDQPKQNYFKDKIFTLNFVFCIVDKVQDQIILPFHYKWLRFHSMLHLWVYEYEEIKCINYEIKVILAA